MYNGKLQPKDYFSLLIIFIISATAAFAQTKRGAGNAPKQPASTSQKPSGNTEKPTVNVEKPATNTPGKKVIVVLDFDDASLNEKKIAVGKQAALFLANKFGESGNYTVVERQRILQILDEQNISQNADRYDAKLAAKIGKIFSANAVVLGTVTEYTVKKSSKGLPGFKKVTVSAKIGLVIRLVDVNTGIVLDSVTVEGIADEKNVATLWSDISTEMTDDLRIRLFTAAANNAVDKATVGLEPSISKVPDSKLAATPVVNNPGISKPQVADPVKPAAVNSNGKIVQVTANSIYISGLQNAQVGNKFAVSRIGREIKDPDSGEILDVESVKIGEIEITEIRPKIVVAKIVSGNGFKVKDVVNPMQ